MPRIAFQFNPHLCRLVVGQQQKSLHVVCTRSSHKIHQLPLVKLNLFVLRLGNDAKQCRPQSFAHARQQSYRGGYTENLQYVGKLCQHMVAATTIARLSLSEGIGSVWSAVGQRSEHKQQTSSKMVVAKCSNVVAALFVAEAQ